MLLLYETAGGHALFELKSAEKLANSDTSALSSLFSDRESTAKKLKLKAFGAYKDTTEAVAAATEFVESKLGKPLRKFLSKHAGNDSVELGVIDVKLGAAIKEKLGIKVVSNALVNEAIRGVRLLCDQPLSDEENNKLYPLPSTGKEVRAMQLGLSHSLSRYKLKFSPDKVDTMVVQAIGLLDDLDKEINTYAMRVREWYGWHFPELAALLNDNLKYAKIVLTVGMRTTCKSISLQTLADVLADESGPDEILAQQVKDVAEMSMGTEVDQADMIHVRSLAEQVVELSKYRARLAQYLSARMQAVAPNLTVLVGDLVGARLVQHAGSILNLAKHPASTIQILGAEKALFRALKTKHDTPKYGLIYHASLVGQAAPKNKGKISRVLAAKCALAVRLDALGEDDDTNGGVNNDLGLELRAKVEMRLRQLESGTTPSIPPSSSSKRKLIDVLASTTTSAKPYSDASHFTLTATPKQDDDDAPKKKKNKKSKDDVDSSSKKKRKRKTDDEPAHDDSLPKEKKKKKKSSSDD